MSLNFLPGRPNNTVTSVCQRLWQYQTLLAYCSGNNLNVLSDNFCKLQTLYLEEDCVSVDINASNGFIAVAFGNKTRIYKPMYQVMKSPKWTLCTEVFHDDSKVNCVKWGVNNELVIGSKYLSLWNIKDEFGDYKPILLWTKLQPKPVYCCDISEDSQLIASYGKYEKTIKLWKRISIGGDENIFNVTLLKHDKAVTAIKWKRYSIDGDIQRRSQVLFSLSEDKKLRAWSCYKLDNGHNVDLWGSLDLHKNQKYCLVLDNWLFKYWDKKNSGHTINRKISRNSDLVILGDSEGNVEVYTLNHLSSDPPRIMTKHLIFSKNYNTKSFVTNPDIIYFAEAQPYSCVENTLSIVIHDLRGVIRHSSLALVDLLDPEKKTLGNLEHKFTGHNKSIQKLIRSSDGEALITTTRFSENCVWKPQYLNNGVTLRLKNMILTESPIEMAVIHERGRLVIALLKNKKLQAWECPNYNELEVDTKSSLMKSEIQINDENKPRKPILMLNTPEQSHNHSRHFIAIFYDDGSQSAYEISETNGISEIKSNFSKLHNSDMHLLSTIDPVHKNFNSNRPLLSVCTKAGNISTFKAEINYNTREVVWHKVHELNSGIEDILYMRGSSTGKMCIVDSTGRQMTLWDSKRGVLEYKETFDEEICDIDWTNTEHHQSVVSIGFENHVRLFTQLRYDYTNNIPSYLPISDINVMAHTAHKIGDSVWLKDGILVVASGNQFYVKDKTLDPNDPFTHSSIGSRMILSNDLFHLSSVLNGPLPVYHPQFLIQALMAEKLPLVKELLLRLFLELKRLELNAKNIIELDSALNIDPAKIFLGRHVHYPKEDFPPPYQEFNNEISSQLTEQLTKIALPYMTRHQQITLMTVITGVNHLMKYEKTVDFNGLRFLLGVKLFQSHKKSQKHVLMRDVSWALHSDNKEILLSIIDKHISTWEHARQYKLAYWAKQDDLIEKFEKIAKYEFSRDDTRDPNRCAVFYLALKKKQILLGLWRVCPGHPEQQKMLKFMNNDFTVPRWRTAALKNAFVLISKHRYLEAACFFLLAESLKDAVGVIYKQLNDVDLAIAVCRVFEGDNGPILGDFLTRELLTTAITDNDKWTTSFIYWKLRKQELAIKALITAPIEMEDNKNLVDEDKVVNKSFLVEDPALLFLYNHLRNRNVRYFLASLDLSNDKERYLILRATEILCRMGCDYLSVSLVKNWRFIEKPNIIELPKSPIKGNNYSGIDTMVEEPTTTHRVRKSLFDKFDNNNDNNNSSKIPPPNLLESFSTEILPSKSSILERSLDDPASKKSGSMSKDIEDKSQEQHKTSSVTPSRSLLDEFMAPPSTTNKSSSLASNHNNLLDEFSSLPDSNKSSTPRNLSDHASEPSDNTRNENQMNGSNKQANKATAPPAAPKVKSLLDDFM
ncbi:Rav1p [Nakaseomyces bracarensis]|uniref:Rav1p n=1 Tax=Nakaseomyces bracarensis TaxID=273131 RepID=UPI003871B370